jgi:hypothetical protein
MPAEIVDRDADVWEALLAVADLAGGDWPDRARVTAVTFVTLLAGSQAETIGVRLLTDLRSIFADEVVLFTDVVLKRLASIEESPWGDWNGRAVDARWLSQHLRKYGVGPRSVRIGDRAAKGYSRADLADPWMRYVPGGVSAEDGSHGSQGSQADERQAV